MVIFIILSHKENTISEVWPGVSLKLSLKFLYFHKFLPQKGVVILDFIVY